MRQELPPRRGAALQLRDELAVVETVLVLLKWVAEACQSLGKYLENMHRKVVFLTTRFETLLSLVEQLHSTLEVAVMNTEQDQEPDGHE
ncbi:uncharacterized protein UV8b_02224 [Ustilaginoidea virens]|uniref:Uncharacterized protein n=1 Tax=Ustilaginoidea virens TaxID=1159556 RepID=A0A8E5HMG3_USTVR|nr:uncharacterized protein UV8b_02224 [Ustilaginoidea virens]QUC17983.1 hypothetical protein UV8b_02224 [Ustilaginoidea virens]